MKKWIALIGLVLLVSACTFSFSYEEGSGVVVSENREVSGFNSVSFEGLGGLLIEIGDEYNLEVKAEDNIIDRIETDVRGDTLEIAFDDNRWEEFIRPTKPIRFFLTMPDLQGLHLSGLGDIDVAEYDGETLVITLTGAGSIEIRGRVESQDVIVSGAGSYDGSELESDQADINLTGAGSATVWVNDNLDVNISGVGSVIYYGQPAVREAITGLGSLKSMGLHP